jgi:uncharacterized membrane protein YphA (DoxX/SURF4 family)
MNLINLYRNSVSHLKMLDGIAPLLFRLVLGPVMIVAGYSKLGISTEYVSFGQYISALPEVVAWFGNSEWGLGLPIPHILGFLAGWGEFLGGWLLLFGVFTRLAAVPLAVTMVVAIIFVHGVNGWFAITPTNPETSPAKVFAWFGSDEAAKSLENSSAAGERLERIKQLVNEHGFPDYLYEKGNIVVLNNGIEFAFIYLAMLLSLIVNGPGRFTSVDYYLDKWMKRKSC